MRQVISKASGVALLVFLLSLAEVACRLRWLDSVYFPAPSATLRTLGELLRSGAMWHHIGPTLVRAGAGYGIAMLIAVPVGLLMGSVRWVGYIFEPIVDMLRPMPSAAVIPVAILLFGIEDRMKIIVIVFGSLWPTIVGAVDGVRGVDGIVLDTGKLLQLSRPQMLMRIVLPAALPAIITGMRISLAIALILGITAEMIAGSNGLGYFILDAERSFAFREMFAGIVVIGVLGYLTSRLFVAVDRIVLFWHYAPRARSEPTR